MEDWQTRTLKDICEFSNGLWKGEKPPFKRVGVIRNTNFTKEGMLDDSDIAYLDVELNKLEKRRLRFGDIILEKSGGGPKQPVGRVALFDKDKGDFSFSNFTAALRVRDSHELHFRFLHKFLHWIYVSGVTEGMQSHSTGIRNLDNDAYKEIKISFPQLPEQKRIVSILDEAFEGIGTVVANTERNIANARELFEDYMNSVFIKGREGWAEKKLGNIATFKNGLNFTKDSKGEVIRIVGVKNFQKDFYVPTDRLETAQIDGRLSADYELRAGDILTVRSNGNKQLIGRCILAKDVPEKTSHSGFTIRIRATATEVLPTYLTYFLKSKSSREALIESGDGANISSLNQRALSSLPVSLPPFSEQSAITERIQAIEVETKNLENIYRQKLNNLVELKQAVLQKAFAGELTAQSIEAVQEAAE